MKSLNSIPSVNYHLWEPCNMRCKFCFATFQDVKSTILPKGHLPKEQSLELVEKMANFGFEKITFVGGEPTLCPWLPELIRKAKECGMNTGIVTNGAKLTDTFLFTLKPTLDWIGLSIDSLDDETNIKMGRAIVGKKPVGKAFYYDLIDKINAYNYKLKINTVVNQMNKNEDLSSLIIKSKTNRWKIFQVLPIKDQNDEHIDEMVITEKQFRAFIERHAQFDEVIVPEDNESMTGSYAMVDPAGRFFENSSGKLKYSMAILGVGVKKAYAQCHPDYSKFIERGGKYKW